MTNGSADVLAALPNTQRKAFGFPGVVVFYSSEALPQKVAEAEPQQTLGKLDRILRTSAATELQRQRQLISTSITPTQARNEHFKRDNDAEFGT